MMPWKVVIAASLWGTQVLPEYVLAQPAPPLPLAVAVAAAQEAERAPARWIGVRVTPVPPPVAAQLGGDGLMIANVAKGSPADQAGLERYDLLLRFGDQSTNSTEDLLAAVERSAAGKSVAATVVRKGQKQTLQITPVERPPSESVEFKYDEPAEDIVDRSMELRGHRLRPGPGGGWMIEPLGPMRGVPDVLKDFYGGRPWTLRLDPDEDGGVNVWPFDEEDEPGPDGQQVEIRIKVDQDGTVTTIQRGADGKIQVEKKDAAGQTQSQTYESLREFREKDPEGYQLYRPYSGHGMLQFFHELKPGQLNEARKEFQIEVKKKLEDALRQSQRAEEQARDALERARRQMERGSRAEARHEGAARREAEAEARREGAAGPHHAPGAAPGGTLSGKGVSRSLEIAEDGTITVKVQSGNERRVYQFDSKESFRESEPELYREFQSLLE